MRTTIGISAACGLLAMTAASLPANADGPKNPRGITNYVHLGYVGSGGDRAEVYYDAHAPFWQADHSVVVDMWLLYDAEQHAREGSYYQMSEAIRIWCDDKTDDANAPNEHFFFWNEDGSKLLFTIPDHYDAARETLPVTPEPIPGGSAAEAVYNALCH